MSKQGPAGEVERTWLFVEHGAVEVVHRSGRANRRMAERASGHPGNPLSEEARLAKLWSCFEHAGEPLPEERLRRPST